MASKKLGRLVPSKTLLLLCDMQEKFAPSISHFREIVETSAKLIDGAKLLNMPIIVTEHYSKGLGKTIPELRERVQDCAKFFDKTQFSMCTKDLVQHIDQAVPDYQSVLLCGIEAHACVLGTSLDFLEQGKDVHVIVDAVSSRSQTDRKFALERMRRSGAFLTTAESVFFQMCVNANHPKFKDIQKLIKKSSPDTGLLKF